MAASTTSNVLLISTRGLRFLEVPEPPSPQLRVPDQPLYSRPYIRLEEKLLLPPARSRVYTRVDRYTYIEQEDPDASA